MKEIKLGKSGCVAIIDDEDYELVMCFKWHCKHDKNTKYAYRKESKSKNIKKIYLHSFVMDSNTELDHKDRNGLNCQKSNLRTCTHQENSRNRSSFKNSSSKYKGVSYYKIRNKYVANIWVDNKSIFLGIYKCELDAALAYDLAAYKYFGDFAFFNFYPNSH
jgi:AP2-like factor (euAP2 lineage)